MLESIVRDKKTINGVYLLQILPDDLIKMVRININFNNFREEDIIAS